MNETVRKQPPWVRALSIAMTIALVLGLSPALMVSKAYAADLVAGTMTAEPKAAASDAIDLTITNNTGMFKAVTASAVENADGSATLTFALSGTGYHYLYKGTYEQAVANGAATENWIAGYQNAGGKWEFQVQIAAGELGKDVPVVAVSQSYYEKYLSGDNSLDRAFFPRQFNLDLGAKTLVTGDYETTKAIAVTNNVSMFKPAAAATLECVGGPNSNNYKADLVLPMESDAMAEVFVGTPAEAEEAAQTIAFDTTAASEGIAGTFTVPVKWVATFGKPETLVNHANGEPFVMSFKSKKNGTWYGRTATLDEEAGTLVFDPWVDPAPANTVDELIAKIQSQVFTDTTWADCEAAKAAWDALSEAEKALVEEYDYFGRDTGDASADDPLNADEIGDNEILVVSFGTSFNGSRAATIGGVEKALQAAYPDWSVRRAFTAQIIINHIYARDGVKIDNVQQAMDRAVANGVKNLVVQPTHLMHGAEYDELVEALAPYQDKMSITVAEPLLGPVGADSSAINDDKLAVAKAVVAAAAADAGYADAAAAAADGAAIVLMGHGTAHSAAVTYEQMQAAMAQLGYSNVFVGTVEGEPESTECGNVIAAVKAAGYTKVFLRPLMVVAGDHANNDMADPDDEESWYSQFTAEGNFDAANVTCQINGLGEIPAVQDLYVAHTAAAMPIEPLDLADGTYTIPGLSTAVLSMYHFDADAARVVIKGDEAWLITSIDGTKEASTLKRFDGMAYGPQSQILDPNDTTNHTLVAGTPTAKVVEVYGDDGETTVGRIFVLPVPKSVFENNSDIYYMIKYKAGYSASHDGDWYKASGGDYYLTKYKLVWESDDTTLPGDEPVPQTGWVEEDGTWYYYYEDGTMATNKWQKDDSGEWCYLGKDGARYENRWAKDSKYWYFMGTDGHPVKNKWQKDSVGWCYLGSDGAMVTDAWQNDSVGKCYMDGDGHAVTSAWKKVDGKWYYFDDKSHAITKQWKKDSRGWLYMGEDGAAVINKWVKDSKGWCYIGSDAYMVTNKWAKDSKHWYYMGSDGHMVKNKWQKDSAGWCYLGSDGAMVTNAWQADSKGNCYLDASGHAIVSKTVTIDGVKWKFDAAGHATRA